MIEFYSQLCTEVINPCSDYAKNYKFIKMTGLAAHIYALTGKNQQATVITYELNLCNDRF